MDVFAINPAAKPLADHLAEAVLLSIPETWGEAELEVRTVEAQGGLQWLCRIRSTGPKVEELRPDPHIVDLAKELEAMYAAIGQPWALYCMRATQDGEMFFWNIYVEFRVANA